MKTNKILGTALLVGLLSACTHTNKYTLYFDNGSSTLTKENKQKLMKITSDAKFDKAKVVISGHADGKGNLKDNIKLSDKRVIATDKEIVELGVMPKKLVKLASSEKSVSPGKDLSQERRVDITVTK